MEDRKGKDLRDLQRQQMRDRKLAYIHVFGMTDNANKLVLADLQRFCRAGVSTFHPDPRVHALLEGRREVVLRIADFINLSIEELCDKYGGNPDDPSSAK